MDLTKNLLGYCRRVDQSLVIFFFFNNTYFTYFRIKIHAAFNIFYYYTVISKNIIENKSPYLC